MKNFYLGASLFAAGKFGEVMHLVTLDSTSITIWNSLLLLFLFFIFYSVIYPQFQSRWIRKQRSAFIRSMEQRSGSKVLSLVHRREAVSIFGLSTHQFIDEEDAELVLRWIRKNREKPLDLILHTAGGQLHSSIQIARALKKHEQHTRVFIPHYSMSGGTIIALAANEIIMDKNAVLSPVDPQIGDLLRGVYPAAAWVYAASEKGDKASDITLVMSDTSRKVLELTRNVTRELLFDRIEAGPGEENKLEEALEKLVSGKMVHSTPLSPEEIKKLGLNVSTDFPEEVHEFMKFFRPGKVSVEYLD